MPLFVVLVRLKRGVRLNERHNFPLERDSTVTHAGQLFAIRAVIDYPNERDSYCPVDGKLDRATGWFSRTLMLVGQVDLNCSLRRGTTITALCG